MLHIFTVNAGVFFAALEVLAFLLSVIAILFSWDAFRKLRKIEQALPTHYVGQFPEHLEEVTDLVNSARRSVKVFGDCVDYGTFGAPNIHDDYMAAIRSKGEKVQYLVWGPPQAFSIANKFLNDREMTKRFLEHLSAKHVAITRKSSIFRKLVRASGLTAGVKFSKKQEGPAVEYFVDELPVVHGLCAKKDARFKNGICKHVTTGQILDCLKPFSGPDVFLQQPAIRDALMLTLHEWVHQKYESAKVSIKIDRRENLKPTLLFWIADKHEAIFLVPTETTHGLAFRTSDHNLIDTLLRMFAEKEIEYEAERATLQESSHR